MATNNFYTKNASDFYIFNDTYTDENGVECYRNENDFEYIKDDIRTSGEINDEFPIPLDNWCKELDGFALCESYEKHNSFGNGNAWLIDAYTYSTIAIRGGYYSGANLDYQVHIMSSEGDELLLSDFNDVDELVTAFMDILYDIIRYRGYECKWNIGTFKMHKNNIHKWLTKVVENEVNKCEKFCKDQCEHQYVVVGRFSNGECVYERVED